MRRTAYLVIITAAALLLASCTVSRKSIRRSGASRVHQSSSSRNTGGSSASLGSAHKSNCSKLGVNASSTDNARLYSECASWLGASYKYGGTTKSGVDCSGFVYMVYKAVFGKTLTELAETREEIVGITAAMPSGTSMKYMEKFPRRYFDVGISEGHAVTFAGGLAVGGKKPFVAIYSSFLQRGFDNIIHDVAIQVSLFELPL